MPEGDISKLLLQIFKFLSTPSDTINITYIFSNKYMPDLKSDHDDLNTLHNLKDDYLQHLVDTNAIYLKSDNPPRNRTPEEQALFSKKNIKEKRDNIERKILIALEYYVGDENDNTFDALFKDPSPSIDAFKIELKQSKNHSLHKEFTSDLDLLNELQTLKEQDQRLKEQGLPENLSVHENELLVQLTKKASDKMDKKNYLFSTLDGIDFNYAVNLKSLAPGTYLVQFQNHFHETPNEAEGYKGQYYVEDPTGAASDLDNIDELFIETTLPFKGVGPFIKINDQSDSVGTRVPHIYQISLDDQVSVVALESTARNITDTWTFSELPIETEGGDTQLYLSKTYNTHTMSLFQQSMDSILNHTSIDEKKTKKYIHAETARIYELAKKGDARSVALIISDFLNIDSIIKHSHASIVDPSRSTMFPEESILNMMFFSAISAFVAKEYEKAMKAGDTSFDAEKEYSKQTDMLLSKLPSNLQPLINCDPIDRCGIARDYVEKYTHYSKKLDLYLSAVDDTPFNAFTSEDGQNIDALKRYLSHLTNAELEKSIVTLADRVKSPHSLKKRIRTGGSLEEERHIYEDILRITQDYHSKKFGGCHPHSFQPIISLSPVPPFRKGSSSSSPCSDQNPSPSSPPPNMDTN